MRGLLLNYKYGMWDAVLKKRKTNTRRGGGLDEINIKPNEWYVSSCKNTGTNQFIEFTNTKTGKIIIVKPRYKPLECAYLQEPVLINDKDIFYKYTDEKGLSEADAFGPLIDKAIKVNGAAWKNKYFMEQKYARYFVQFTSWKCERLNDISHEDILKEGVVKSGDSYYYTIDGVKTVFPTAKNAYFSLYNAVNNIKENNNPWLFSYYFELTPNPE